jgi:phage terminase large subunit GpA-like protein
MREPLDCCDIDHPCREIYFKKGVQITWSTLLESCALYYMGHVRTRPMMYVTADDELAKARMENNFLPMLHHSDMDHIIRSSDIGNTRKTGNTKNHLQFEGGGYLVPAGSLSVGKSISYSICVMMLDEVDTYPENLKARGDPFKEFTDRCSGYWDWRKILAGGTPKTRGVSLIDKLFLRGDQRLYYILCRRCGFAQVLRWSTPDEVGGFKWDFNEAGTLILESVRYCCQSCGGEHFEYDKEVLFSPEGGAYWEPTAAPVEPNIRSYHLPGMYSPVGLTPWYKNVSMWLDAYDYKTKKVKDIKVCRVFYNNVLGESFQVLGSKIEFTAVSGHRRTGWSLGTVPNKFAVENMGGPVLFVTCTVDVQKRYLSVLITGWTVDAKSVVIDHMQIDIKEGVEADECPESGSSVWPKLREIIDEKIYPADDGREYRVNMTLVDAGYANSTVIQFCKEWASGVYPILGRDRPAKYQKIMEFAPFTTRAGTKGYRILVDIYKERISSVLRRTWAPGEGQQKEHHFNAPVDMPDAALKELTREELRKRYDPGGKVSYYWHRPHGSRNELFDLLVYAHAAVEIYAWQLYVEDKDLEAEEIDWVEFWKFLLDSLDPVV